MALDKEYGKIKLVCDYCGETHEFDTFQDAMDFMETEGWAKHRIGIDWSHKCGDCV